MSDVESRTQRSMNALNAINTDWRCSRFDSEGRLNPKVNNEGRHGLLRMLKGRSSSAGASSAGKDNPTGTKPLQIVNWDGYQSIDREEVARGVLRGKPREKLVNVDRMLEVAQKSSVS